HLIVLLGEQLLKMHPRVLVQSLEDLGIHPRDAVGGLPQSLAIGVFAHGAQDLADRAPDALEVHVRSGRARVRRLVVGTEVSTVAQCAFKWIGLRHDSTLDSRARARRKRGG